MHTVAADYPIEITSRVHCHAPLDVDDLIRADVADHLLADVDGVELHVPRHDLLDLGLGVLADLDRVDDAPLVGDLSGPLDHLGGSRRLDDLPQLHHLRVVHHTCHTTPLSCALSPSEIRRRLHTSLVTD